MRKVKIFTVGKIKEPWLSAALEEYAKRLKPYLAIEWHLAKDSQGLSSLLEKESSYICLDINGAAYSSEAFSDWFQKAGSRLSFVIGGAEGLSPRIKERAAQLLSLSPLTFTHQMVRLLLVEQLYRALEIEKGSGYHK